jgi:hypothetical protein
MRIFSVALKQKSKANNSFSIKESLTVLGFSIIKDKEIDIGLMS